MFNNLLRYRPEVNTLVKIRMWQNPPRPESPKPGGPLRKSSLTGKQPPQQDKTQGNEDASRKATQEILGELDQLIGLSSVKKLVKEIQAFVEIQKLRQKEKLIYEPMVLHMIFKGNPGTGKTTVARIIGRLFKEMGVLPKGHLIEVERADLVGEYIGHTAAKTRDQIKKALGGILFIDEAYSLARGGEKDFGKEAIDSMVASMENNKDNLIIILAGYQDEMNYFLETNPGLRSRFPIHITFPDYTLDELMEIADLMLKQRQYVLAPLAREELYKILQNQTRKHEHSGNARLVRNLIERAMRHQAVRLVGRKNITRDDLMTINKEDLTEALEEI